MLHEFITGHHEDIVARARDRAHGRPFVSDRESEHGVPLFLTQLSEILRLEATLTPFSSNAIGLTATRHGAELAAAGFNVGQVVHHYGDIGQAIADVANEHHTPITIDEFRTLNRCLDAAIADAVTEHTRLAARRRSEEEIERLGQTAHELRDVLNGALLAFHTLKRDTVAINGSIGAVLGRSLTSLRQLIDRTLSEVRLATGTQRRERLSVNAFVDDLAAVGVLHSADRGLRFRVAPIDPGLAVDADPQLLTSAVMNLLHNAFKNTPSGGTVVLRVHARGARLLVDIQDECGGLPESRTDPFQAFGDRRGTDRSGLGLGLSIARRAVRAHDGDIHIRNIPGQGCIFTVDVPLAVEVEAATVAQ